MAPITKHPQHDHFFFEDGYLFESYKTIRGLRCQPLMPINEIPINENLEIITDDNIQS
jgi:hypothetical protein